MKKTQIVDVELAQDVLDQASRNNVQEQRYR
jgi:hypothetical protein